MKRKIIMAFIIIICALLQCTVFNSIAVASVKPNLLLILTVSFGLMRGRKSGALTGFFSGLCADLMSPGAVLGFQALSYLWIGYAAGFTYRIFYDDDIKTPLMLTAVGDFCYGIIQYAALFLLRGRIHIFFYLRRIIIPEMLYTVIVTIFIYRLIYSLNKVLSKTDKRSIDSLV